MRRIGVAGAGAWGTALALVAARGGAAVHVWAREPEVRDSIRLRAENTRFLPGVALPPAIRPEAELAALAACDAVLVVVPAQHVRAALSALAPAAPPGLPIVLCAKGIERTTGRLMTEVLAETLPAARPGVLSGPSFAGDVAAGLPTAVTLAAADPALGEALVAALGGPAFRPYLTDDLIGAEIGGAVKNVLAIACGIAEGRGLGDSARAALITRGFAELARFGRALGARDATLMGLAGLGDLVLTCSSTQSRNYTVGRRLGAGEPLAAIQAGRRDVAEGVETAPALLTRAAAHGIEMPIAAAVAGVLAGTRSLEAAIAGLLARPFRPEGV